jgi:hypothetical protein
VHWRRGRSTSWHRSQSVALRRDAGGRLRSTRPSEALVKAGDPRASTALPGRRLGRSSTVIATLPPDWSLGSRTADRMSDHEVKAYCGIDWAESHHDIAIVDAEGRLPANQRITDDIDGWRQLVLLAVPCWCKPRHTRRSAISDAPRTRL